MKVIQGGISGVGATIALTLFFECAVMFQAWQMN